MTDSSSNRDMPKIEDLQPPPQVDLSAEEAATVHGGAAVLNKTTQMDESPKETVTFEYGGLSVHYTTQSPGG